MSEQPPTQPAPGAPAPGAPVTPSTAAPLTAAPASTSGATIAPPVDPKVKKAPQELTGFRKSLEHTGLPRSVIGWKPRLPSRNWCIFLTVVGTISYIYYDDRKKCREIKEKYIEAVKPMAEVPLKNTLDMPRKVTVYAARWPEDDENDRGLVYFRKYVKPYLAAAAIDYELVNAPLYGSVARIVRAKVLKERREALNLNEGDILAPIQKTEKELELEKQEREGGIVLMGRPTMKEFLAGLRAGWGNGVGEWVWEKSVKSQLSDEPFEDPVPEIEQVVVETSTPAEGAPMSAGGAVGATGAVTPTGGVQHVGLGNPVSLPPIEDDEPRKRGWFSGLLGGKHTPATPPQQQQQPQEPKKFEIPPNWHEPPSPLPEQKPVLLVDWCNHLGFKQIPYMIYDFFTEHKRVQSGAEAAFALITEQARPFRGPATPVSSSDSASLALDSAVASSSDAAPAPAGPKPDTDFDAEYERFYKKDYAKTPESVEKDRTAYYTEKLPKRVEAAKQFARGEREITTEEKRSDKPVETVQILREERAKKELRWAGNVEGFEIVRPEAPVAWDPRFAGWLQVYEASPESLQSVLNAPSAKEDAKEE